jgi:flavodoxin
MLPMKSLLICYSYHHKNTEKIASTFAKILDAQIKKPQQIKPEELQEYTLIGFGSGIYDEKHHKTLLDLADNLPHVTNKNAFIFSTSGWTRYASENHAPLREKLQSKGYVIDDEFNCPGFDTYGGSQDANVLEKLVARFNTLIGGINKGRPNADDLKQAEAFAQNLKKHLTTI